MNEIEGLQGRIYAAMQRIGAGVEALDVAKAEGPDPAELQAALEAERLAGAQIEERLNTIKDRHANEIETLKAEVSAQADAMSKLDMDIQRLRQANQQLRESNIALREANEEGVGEPHLINKAMLAELEGLRASREVDAAETGAILAKLEPLLAAAAMLPETGEEEEA